MDTTTGEVARPSGYLQGRGLRELKSSITTTWPLCYLLSKVLSLEVLDLEQAPSFPLRAMKP